MTERAAHVGVIEESPAYWRIVLDPPPLNIVGASMFAGLQDLLARMDTSPSLRVVVFESANPDFYLAHFDLADLPGSLGLIKRSEEHTSELQSHSDLVCRLLLEKKKTIFSH